MCPIRGSTGANDNYAVTCSSIRNRCVECPRMCMCTSRTRQLIKQQLATLAAFADWARLSRQLMVRSLVAGWLLMRVLTSTSNCTDRTAAVPQCAGKWQSQFFIAMYGVGRYMSLQWNFLIGDGQISDRIESSDTRFSAECVYLG